MPSPFPGMDPYLEHPTRWSGVHAAILAAIFEQLGPAVRPKYAVRFEERVYVTSEDDPAYRSIIPDIRIVERDPHADTSTSSLAIAEPIKAVLPGEEQTLERSLQVIDLDDRSVVTVIELLSPANKTIGAAGRESFLRKRAEIFAGDTHWVEIDLLRDGVRTPRPTNVPDTDYRVFLSRAGSPREAFVWPVRLTEKLPTIAIPLRSSDQDVPLNLQTALNAAVERGSYDLTIDYAASPVPPLSTSASEWARMQVLRYQS